MDSGRHLSLLAVASSRACFVYLAPSISYAPATQDTQATHQAEDYLGFHRPQRRLEPLGHRSSHPFFFLIVLMLSSHFSLCLSTTVATVEVFSVTPVRTTQCLYLPQPSLFEFVTHVTLLYCRGTRGNSPRYV